MFLNWDIEGSRETDFADTKRDCNDGSILLFSAVNYEKAHLDTNSQRAISRAASGRSFSFGYEDFSFHHLS